MESLWNLLVGIVLASVIIMIVSVAISIIMLVLAINILNKRKHRIADLEKAANPYFFSGTVADMRCTQEPLSGGAAQLYYAFALHYTAEDGTLRRALLGVRTMTPMNITVGSTVQLAVFAMPLIQPSPQAFDPMRGADGMLPPQVELCTWMDRPIDETGTVMLYDDYQAALDNAHRKNRTGQIIGWVLIVFVILRVVTLFGSGIMSYFRHIA